MIRLIASSIDLLKTLCIFGTKLIVLFQNPGGTMSFPMPNINMEDTASRALEITTLNMKVNMEELQVIANDVVCREKTWSNK